MPDGFGAPLRFQMPNQSSGLVALDCWLIQNALPDLTADQRETILTSIGPEEWDRTFKDTEE